MALSRKAQSEGKHQFEESPESEPKSPREALLARLTEIEQTLDGIHHTQEEIAQISKESGKRISQILVDSEKRIKRHQEEIARLHSESEALRAKLVTA